MFFHLPILTSTFFIIVLVTLRLWRLVANYRLARQTGLPILILPFSWQDRLWLLIGPHFLFLRHLPLGLGDWVEFSLLGWQLQDRYSIHATVGPTFILVSPGKNELVIADAIAGEHVIAKYKDWVKSEELYESFSIFGSNVVSVNGKAWQRHRKIAGPAFKEATNRIVWQEAGNQAVKTAKLWSQKTELNLADLSDDTCHLVMKVLMAAGFGKQFEDEIDVVMGVDKKGAHIMTYSDSLRFLLQNMTLAILFSKLKAPSWLLPPVLRRLLVAVREFRQYTDEKIADERQAIANGQPENNLLSALVQANEAAHDEEGAKMILSDNELYGNIFIFSLAGFETTATALTYALPLLAANPSVQDWVAEEIQQVFSNNPNPNYDKVFPHLTRTMAVMHETLRLWGSVQGLARYTDHSPQPLTLDEKTYTIPPETYVTVNLTAIHCNPSVWGPDPLSWRPERWITHSPTTGEEMFAGTPPGGAFLAWSAGPRVCPGRKFSQVEFAAVISKILMEYRIVPKRREEGETEEGARERLEAVVGDSETNLSPKIRRPRDAGVVFAKRG